MRSALLTAALILSSGMPAHAENWMRIKSEHFTVISDGSEKQARQIAKGFEQIHAVIAAVLPGLRTDSGAETIVIAPRDEQSFVKLVPFEKKRADNIAGQFFKGWERDYVLVRLDIPDENRNIVYHEYIHKILHLNFTRLPTWLDEGLAEFFGNTWMRSDGIFVGAPSPRLALLRERTLYPLGTILTVNPGSPYYRDWDKAGMFYAESWGLTHYLMFGENLGAGQKMNAYLALLQKGTESLKAFDQAFGPRDEVEKNFSKYSSRFMFTASRMNKMPNIDASNFAGGPMSPAETDAMLGGFYTKLREMDLASGKLTAALNADPKSALVHENAAFLYFQQGQDEGARKEFDQAVSLDPNHYLSLYYQALLKYHGKTDADSLSQLSAVMDQVTRLNPNFAPAVVVRSQILVRQKKLQEAYNTSMEAQRLEPDRAGYLTNSAAILLLGHNYAGAVKNGEAVAARWTDSDSAEALAVVAQARRLGKIEQSAEEKTLEDSEMEYAKDTTAVEGVIQSVHCDKSKPMELELQSGDKILKFHSGKNYGVGFSDTLWYGTDHFTACYHVEGMNAVVRYKPSDKTSDENEMQWLEIRDELIPTSLPPESLIPAAPAGKTPDSPRAN